MTDKPQEYRDIHWLPEESYQKSLGQFRLQISGVLHPLRTYGQDPFVDQAIDEIVKLAENFGLRVRGIDKPISLEIIRSRK